MSEADEIRERIMLSSDECKAIHNDMFGGSSTRTLCLVDTSEDNDDIRQGLEEMEEEIDQISPDRRKGLSCAEQECPHLLDTAHKLKFLRWADFDGRKAALRWVAYWDDRVNVFQEKAFMPLTQAWALRDDFESISACLLEILPVRDRHGRAILYVDTSLQDRSKYRLQSMLRAIWYELHCALEDKEVQCNGVVAVVYDEKTVLSEFDRKLYKQVLHAINHSLPIKIKAIHQCHPNRYIHLVLPVAKFMLGRFLRTRFEMHRGSKKEVLRQLDEYGIDARVLPPDMGGALEHDRSQMLDCRATSEEGAASGTVSATEQEVPHYTTVGQ